MRYLIPILILTTALIGCSQGGSPMAPGFTGETGHQPIDRSGLASQWLWGLWNIECNPDTGQVSVAPMRHAYGLYNVTTFLQPPLGNLANIDVEILDAGNLQSEGRIDLNVTLTHPFPKLKLRGFDVRGVVMGDGSIVDGYNSDIIYPGHNYLRLLNSDGYTRWMNASEFGAEGVLGYKPGALGSRGYMPSATINGYRYFADTIEPDEPVFDYFASSLGLVASRGSMTPGTSITREYDLKFPTDPLRVKFQYAVIAGWEKAASGGDAPSPSDFPRNANSFEPIALSIVDSSMLFMEGAQKGGDIDLRLNIVDWWAYWDSGNLPDHISKVVISSDTVDLTGSGGSYVEFDFSGLDRFPTSAANAEAVDILIPDAEVSDVENQEVLIAIEMAGYDYTNPYGVPNDANTDALTGYFLHMLNVSSEYNDPPVISSGVDGDASVFLTDVETYTVTASDEDDPVLEYAWTIRDCLTQEVLIGPDPGDGSGGWEINWAEANTPGEVEIHCTVSDGENDVDAEPLSVIVTDVIFHADLNDTTTGDNAGWTSVEQVGISKWSSFVGHDNVLQGYGYKFGVFNTFYVHDSADILVTPEIGIPDTVDRALAVVFHCYEFEYFASLEIGLDGGNFKVTQAPTLPTYTHPEAEIIGGMDYEGWLFDTQLTDQRVFYSDLYTDQLVVSAFEIPPAFIGSDVHIGFAVATDYSDAYPGHGWLIDDVQVRALPAEGNAPPIAGGSVTGDDLVPLLSDYPGRYEVIGYDLENDELTYAWTVRDPGGDILWGPVESVGVGEMTIDWTEIGSFGDYEVHASIYDGHHPGVPALPLEVTVQDPVFHADFSDTTTGDNAGWSGYLESGSTSWTTDVGSDGNLDGFGYKWGEFNTPYHENSQGILLSPPIDVPAGVSRASLYVRHDFLFLASLDGGNFKVVVSPQMPSFDTIEENIDHGWDYDVELTGTVMDGQDAFGTPSGQGLMTSRMDLISAAIGNEIRLGIAVGSGDTFFNMRGWLIDDVVVAVTR